jgi:hypothetical protein
MSRADSAIGRRKHKDGIEISHGWTDGGKHRSLSPAGKAHLSLLAGDFGDILAEPLRQSRPIERHWKNSANEPW